MDLFETLWVLTGAEVQYHLLIDVQKVEITVVRSHDMLQH